MNWKGNVALITGASSGIGAATARKLAHEGLKVVLVARREDRLQALAEEIQADGGEALVIAADLTLEEERQRVYDTVHATWGPAEVLVNNAGLGWYGYGAEMPWPAAQRVMQVNMDALVHFTLLLLPGMRTRGHGHVVNVGSIAGNLPSQGVAIYSATKAFVDNFTTCLHREMRGSGVQVSVVKPGPVTTEFFDVASCAGRQMPAERFGVRPEAVAGRIWSVLRHPVRMAYVPRFYWFAQWVEPYFGWIMDLLGPLLLRRAEATHL
jgi:short-subunit dehydrogenase